MQNSLFPLPLAAFEEYMFRDDGPGYPMHIIARLRFAGQLDRADATRAFEQAVARHPLLRAKIQKTATGRLQWIAAGGCPAALTWSDDALPDRLPAMAPLNLLVEHGLKAWVAAASEESTMVLQAHHAACDGKAVLQLAEDFLRGYARAIGGRDCSIENDCSTESNHWIEQAPCDAELLRGRGRCGLTLRAFLRMLPAQLGGVKRVRQFFMHRPVPLLATSIAAACDMPAENGDISDSPARPEGCFARIRDVPVFIPVVHVEDLEAGELQRLTEMAAVRGVTLNDWLLRDFFLAVNDFRRRHEITAPGEWIRVSVPINLRAPGDGRMPAANLVSMVFLDRNPRQIADPARLLDSVHNEMDVVRRRRWA